MATTVVAGRLGCAPGARGRGRRRRIASTGTGWRGRRLEAKDGADDDDDVDDVDSDVDDGNDRRLSGERLEAALREAREILEEACAMASEQAREELMRGMGMGIRGAGGAGASDVAQLTLVQMFLRGKGLRDFEAERVARDLYEMDALYQDAELLAVKFDRLSKALSVPGLEVGRLVANCPELVSVDLTRATSNLMTLREHFKVEKIASMLYDCPRVLICEDLTDRLRRTRICIQRIFKSETDEDTIYAVSEEPNLLFTLCDLEIFQTDTSVDISELPMSVQGTSSRAREIVLDSRSDADANARTNFLTNFTLRTTRGSRFRDSSLQGVTRRLT